ncbi:MAG: HflC protein [Gammaproteobacteria bacterium]|nr:HflC protein [Gammaproteobacteria bacterium]|tara:strand:+ start:5235 stop:6098 length:864 start_codon:yes stop_codon:yes gene_type:complete
MRNILSIFLVAIALILLNSIFTVDERELALKFRFGEVIQTGYEPGLHLKVPFVNNVEKYPKRILTINNPQELFLTLEKKNLYVDFFIKWKINDVQQYYRATGGDELVAAQRLLETVKDGVRSEFAKRTVIEVVSEERRDIMGDMLERAAQNAITLGIELIDVRVKKIELSDEVSESVYNRMRQERARIASELRAEGAETAEIIRAEADRNVTVIVANAYKDSEIIKGEGDARQTEIYASAYEKDSEFYSFTRSIEAYKKSVGTGNDILVLDAKGDFFKYLNQSKDSE